MATNTTETPVSAPPGPTPQKRSAPPPSSKSTSLNIPMLSTQDSIITLGRMDSVYQIVDVTVQIANQDTLSGATYDQMEQLSTIDLPITRANFIRMWKTLILKRTQDIFENAKGLRPDNFIRIGRNLILPAPLGDLLHCMGWIHSTHTGHSYNLIPPARAQNEQGIWVVDNAILAQWSQLMGRMTALYTTKEYPSPLTCKDAPLVLTMPHIENNIAHVRSWTPEPRIPEALVRIVNDDLFAPYIVTFEGCGWNMTHDVHVPSLRARYVQSYALGSTA